MVTVRVEVLGAFRLVVDGVVVDVGRRQVRALLARLGCAEGSVSSESLIELLWGARLPLDPERSLRVAVSRARSVLGRGSEALVYSPNSYELKTSCDAHELLDASAMSVEALGECLALWRSVPFEGLGETGVVDWFVFERERLVRARSTLVAQLVSGLWFERSFAEVEQVGRDAVERDNFDELMVSFVAMACARLGRQGEALEVIEKCRVSLRDSGLVVSTALATVENEILSGGIDFVAPSFGAADDDGRGAVIGRDGELAQVLSSIDAGRPVGVVGEPGIGKTALVEVLIERLAGRGDRVYVVAAPVSAERPLHTLGLLAEQIINDMTGSGVRVAPLHSGALARVVPGWEGSADVESDPVRDRDDLVNRLVDFVLSYARGAVIVVDDWHWIDAVSAQGIERLIASKGCAVVLASRPVEAAAVTQAVGDLVSDNVILGPLDEVDVGELVGKEFPGIAAAVIADMALRSGGNPLFVRLLAGLVVEGADLDSGLPTSVLIAVKRRLEVLSFSALSVIEHAAILGHMFDIGVLVELVGESAHDALAQAQAVGLVEIDGDDGTGRFVHALVAEGAAQMLSGAQRIAAHDAAGHVIENLGSAAASYVAHCIAAADLDPQRCVDSCLAAAEEYLAAFVWEEALRYASIGVDLVSSAAVSAQPIHHLLLIKGQAMFAMAQSGSYDTLLNCAQQAAANGDSDVLVDAMLELCHHGSLVLTGMDPAPVVEVLEEALRADVSLTRRTQLQAATARLLAYSPDHERGQQLYKQALSQLEHIRDRQARRVILRHAEHGLAHPADHGEACDFFDAILSDAVDDPELTNHVQWFQFQRAVINADVQALNRAPALSLERDSQARTTSYVLFGQTSGQSMQTNWVHSSVAVLAGDNEAAEHHANAALHAGLEIIEARTDGFGRGMVFSGYGSLLLAIRTAQGRLGELRPVIDNAVATTPDLPAWQAALCAVAHAEQDTTTATAILERLAANNFTDLVPDITWTGAMWLLAAPAAELATGNVCEQLYALMLPYEDRMSFTGFSSLGPMHTALAVLAERLGRSSDAANHQQQAAVLTARLHTITIT